MHSHLMVIETEKKNTYKILTFALILWGLGYGLRTLNTLSQVMGYPNYRVSKFTHCFDSLAIRLWSKHLKHLIPILVRPRLQG